MNDKFNFIMNPRENRKYEEDRLFTAEKINDRNYKISWQDDEMDKDDFPVYPASTVSLFISDKSWLIKGN
ncbi:hypothetical protein [Priestia flexa]|uniref:hypothetical protein n=1 Tax=Priestia flexa TaxID=86664 RepID=UPI00047362AB|nr:hypothetical protein [Priestia flexa]